MCLVDLWRCKVDFIRLKRKWEERKERNGDEINIERERN